MNKIPFSKKDELVFEKLSKQGPLGKRALFIFQYLFLRQEFKDFVKLSRESLKIPVDGFDPSKTEDMKIFLNKYVTNYHFGGEIVFQKNIDLRNEKVDVGSGIEKWVEQCGILAYAPNMYLADGFIRCILKEYILFNDFVGIYKGAFALTSIATYDQERDYEEPKEIRLEIPISAKKEEIIDYINETWEALEYAKKKVLTPKDFVRFRPRNNFIRDLKIFNKYIEIENLSRKQRKEKLIDYIEIGVIRELKNEGMSDLPDSGTVRSIVSRLRNEIKDKNAFWEKDEEVDEEEIVKEQQKNSSFDDF